MLASFVYLSCLAVVTTGVSVGVCMSRSSSAPVTVESFLSEIQSTLLRWDGVWYLDIASHGYSYTPGEASSVAFFPVYPMTASAVSELTGFGFATTLLVVSHASFLISLLLMERYASSVSDDAAILAPLALALWPVSFFFVMAYSESLFLGLSLVVFYGIRKHHHPLVLAVIVGIASASRPVGVALWPSLVMYVLTASSSHWQAARRLLFAMPVAISGFVAYMVFQFAHFGTPLAFATTQGEFRFRPPVSLPEKLVILASGEPFWAVYQPDWPTHWSYAGSPRCPFASLQAANPILFGAGVVLVAYGWKSRILNAPELLFSIGMLAIPYVTRAYEMNMSSHARFVLPIAPIFVVLARIVSMFSGRWRCAYFAISALFLFVYSFALGRGYVLI